MAKLETTVIEEIDVWPYTHTSMIKNQRLDYYGTDNLEIYNRNLKYCKEDWIFLNTPVSYNFNKQGLRMPKDIELVNDNYILFSGTSNAMGIGIPELYRYSENISKNLKLDFINFAGPTFTTKIQIISFFNLLKTNLNLPKILIFEYPPHDAYTYYSDDSFIMSYVKHMPSKTKYKNHIDAYNNLLNTDFFIKESEIYRNMLIGTCKRLKIKLIELSFHKNDLFSSNKDILTIDIDSNKNDVNYCYGRDLRIYDKEYTAHPGIGIHSETTKKVLDLL